MIDLHSDPSVEEAFCQVLREFYADRWQELCAEEMDAIEQRLWMRFIIRYERLANPSPIQQWKPVDDVIERRNATAADSAVWGDCTRWAETQK